MLRVGVDVGGTNTDAVLMDGRRLVAAFKTPTTADVESGVVKAISELMGQKQVAAASIGSVMIGTTQFTNAFVERRRLVPIGVIRIALPATTSIPPLYSWPREMLDHVGNNVDIVRGGYEFDGREIAPLDEMAVAAAARRFRHLGLKAIAISCVFAPVDAAMEHRAAEIVRNEVNAQVSISSSFGRIGLIERENAAAMNASLSDLASKVVGSFRRAIKTLGIEAPFYISQNDGTLMTADEVEQRPVMTFASGPTNSMRGAAFLSGLDNAIVLDIGGTTADLGSVVNSFPRESAVAVDIGGVRTNFRMPDLISLGLGGGSLVIQDGDKVRIGPQSVGYRLTEQAMVFGGSVLTATDIIVAAGADGIGDRSRVAHLAPAMVTAAMSEIRRMVEDAVDRIKTNRQDVPLLLVGGGSILVNGALSGTSQVVVPESFSVANAVGAAIAQVGGEVDSYFSYDAEGREAVLERAKATATAEAVKAGADPTSVRIVDIEEVPLGYLSGGAVRVRVKAIGDLRIAHEV